MTHPHTNPALYWQSLLDRLLRKETAGPACLALIQTIPPQLYKTAPVLQLQHAMALIQVERSHEALPLLLALQDQPGIDQGMLNLNIGACHSKQLAPEKALLFYDKAQKTGLDIVQLYRNLIGAHLDLGQTEPAHAIYKAQIPRFQNDHDFMSDYAEFLLATADFKQGFKLYQHRWLRKNTPPLKIKQNLPIWDGVSEVHSLLLLGEQGIGDQIVYSASIPALLEQVEQLTLVCDPRLFSLFSRTWPSLRLLSPKELMGMTDEAIHQHWQMQLLAADACQYALHDIGWKKGYLQPDTKKARSLRQKYQAQFPQKKLIGIAWHSNRKDGAKMKSIPLEQWQPILENPDCQFISLQYGHMNEELDLIHKKLGIHIYQDPEIDSFADLDGLTAQIHALDLSISISTTTAHLAAASHAPLWTILPQHLFWYWGFLGENCDWYPDVRIFRFTEMTSRTPDIPAVAKALHTFLTQPHSQSHKNP